MSFRLVSFFNPYLSPGSTRVDAIFQVTAEGASAPAGDRCIGFVIDCSGSMFHDGKIEAAKHAVRRAIAGLDPDVRFFVVAFGTEAGTVVRLAKATPEAKREADRIVANLNNMGGTAMSNALAEARKQVGSVPGAIAAIYFLTDGKNESEKQHVLLEEVERCKGLFQCDCRGVGLGWSPTELRLISNALLGTADAVPDPDGLAADFQATLSRALSKGLGSVRLELWRPGTSKLEALRQMQPDTIDMMGMAQKVSERVTAFNLGSWGEETRDYVATFRIEAGDLGEELLVCRPYVVWSQDGEDRKAEGTRVVATWSENADLTARISKEVAHYNGQTELADSIREGIEARSRGNEAEATRLLGKATRIAHESGNEEVTRRLSKVVDIEDAESGTVRLRKADRGAELELDMASTRTVRRAKAE